MNGRVAWWIRSLSILTVMFLVVARLAAGQAASAPARNVEAKKSPAPRTPEGRPDLQGIWNFGTATPLERPAAFAGKPVLTDQEAAAYLKTLANDGCRIANCNGSAQGRLDSAYDGFWFDWGDKLANNRTSLIVDPSDGRVPALTAEAQARISERQAERKRRGPADGPEDLSMADRCLLGFNSGPPMTPSAYNNVTQIFQTADYVVIVNEMIHNARIVPLDGRPHLSAGLMQWVGDSRGRWEGDTLVVETTNFRKDVPSRSIDPERFRLVERFGRVDANTLQYEYTMSDAPTWTKPWTVRVPMTRSSEPLYEYACHEGNYSMFNRLSGARSDEQGGAKK
jgi:hypothetical protein